MFDIERTPISETIARMAALIDSVIAANHLTIGPTVSDITPFHSRAVPGISVHDYLERVAKFVCLENDTLIAILVYLDRITRVQSHRPALAPSPYNIHRLLITAIVVAHKFNSDIFFNNARYSKVGGVPLAEMNQLELEMLFLVRFDLKIDADELQRIGDWLLTKPRVKLSNRQHVPVGTLSLYYDEQLALARHTAKPSAPPVQYAHPTPALLPSGQNGGVSFPPLELSSCAPQNVDMFPLSSYTTGRQAPRDIPQPPKARQQQQHPPAAGAAAELTTPSSLNTPCNPASPICRGCPSCDIDHVGMGALEDAYRAQIVNMQPNFNAGHTFGGDVAWRDSMVSPFSPVSPTEQVFGSMVNQKRRRIQPIGIIPAVAAQNVAPAVVNGGNGGAESD